MTKQPHPHRFRVLSIKTVFLLIALAALLAVWLSGCAPRYGTCPYIHKGKFNAWIRCKETGVTAYFNEKSKLVHICKK